MSTANIRQKTDQNIRKKTARNSIKKEYHAEINDLICDALDAIGNGIIPVTPTDSLPTPNQNIIYQAMTAGNYTNLKNAAGGPAQLYDEDGQAIPNNEVTEEDLSVGVQLQYDAVTDKWTKKIQQIELTQYTPNGGYTGSAQDLENTKIGVPDLTLFTNPELFSVDNTESGKIDPSTFQLASDPAYIRTKPIPVKPSTQYDFTGFGTVHYGIVIRFVDSNGNYISGSGTVAAVDASAFNATSPATAAAIQFICKTAKTGDNTDLSLISLKEHGPVDKVIKIKDYTLYSELAVNKDELALVPNVGKNKFPLGVSKKGYYDPTTFLFVSSSPYRATPLIGVPASTSITISGLSSHHYGIGIAFYKADGVTQCSQKGIQSAVDVNSVTVITPSDCAFVGYTWLTSKAGDDAVESTQQLEIGATATAYEAPVSGVKALGIYPIVADSAPTNPTKGSDPISLSYFNAKVGLRTIGKTIFIFGDSITDTSDRTNWPTFAMPILGILPENVYNFAKSGAHWEDFAGATVRQKLSEQIADALATGIVPDMIVISIGTNSFYQDTRFGSYEDAMSKAYADLNLSVVMDAQRKLMYDLVNVFPDARKFYGTPLQRASLTVDTERGMISQYELMAKNYNYTVIDAFNESGYLHEFLTSGTPTRYSDDGLHPNAIFKPILGKFYAYKILNAFF